LTNVVACVGHEGTSVAHTLDLTSYPQATEVIHRRTKNGPACVKPVDNFRGGGPCCDTCWQ